MTEIATVYAALVTRIESLLTTHKRLSNAYDLPGNSDQLLAKGWGLALRPARNTNRFLDCKVTVERAFTISLVRKFVARELDPLKKADTEVALMEDLQILIDDFEKNNALLTTGKYLVKYIADSGIVAVRPTQDAFLAIVVDVTVEYQRTLT